MSLAHISRGTVHTVPPDIRNTLASDSNMHAMWESLTPLARNEWICWVISVQTPATRKYHLERMRDQLKKGMRRPCCWYGCVHRTDKKVSPSVQALVLNRRGGK